MKNPVPLCTTCRHWWYSLGIGNRCERKLRPAGTSPVDGSQLFKGETPSCDSERNCSIIDRLWRCGPSGRFHEPRHPATPATEGGQ